MLNLENIKDRNIHIIGLSGTEGSAIAFYLHKKGFKNLSTHDFCEKEKFKENFLMYHGALDLEARKKYFQEIEALPIKKNFKDSYLNDIESADLIFTSQAWYLYEFNYPKLQAVYDKKIPFFTIYNLYLSVSKAKTIGITGSNGKTTSSRLIYEIFKTYNPNTLLVGNDRASVQNIEAVENLNETDFLILEVSNRQLKLSNKMSPNIGIITNITENHLNEHKSIDEYSDVKFNIVRHQSASDMAIINFDDVLSRQMVDKSNLNSSLIGFSKIDTPLIRGARGVIRQGVFVQNKKIFVRDKNKEIEILDIKDIKIPGEHNLENILGGVAVSYFANIPIKIIKNIIINFTGVEKRLEFLKEISGVKYYNDLSSTTPTSTIVAIKAFKNTNTITLIIGGDDKGVSYDELSKELSRHVQTLILMPGTASEKLLICPLDKGVCVFHAKTALEAFKIAKEHTKSGGVVLLSPSGEGFFTKFLNRRTGGMSLERILAELER